MWAACALRCSNGSLGFWFLPRPHTATLTEFLAAALDRIFARYIRDSGLYFLAASSRLLLKNSPSCCWVTRFKLLWSCGGKEPLTAFAPDFVSPSVRWSLFNLCLMDGLDCVHMNLMSFGTSSLLTDLVCCNSKCAVLFSSKTPFFLFHHLLEVAA